ncbi:hypothetical protein OIO90_005959 [Microbotryomycetes sp. JL221]|nr:hypothetical protein OIO90_005959 [Microbotryomycetes sp. JL221]
MSNNNNKKPVTTPEEWSNRLAGVDISKHDLNAIIANYLFTEGYSAAAENFTREANIEPPIDLESIESRMSIRRAVQSGNVEQATIMVNELDPEILDTNPTLHFHLLQLQLIELIRHGQINEALMFAQSELAPKGQENPQFLKELERTMALLAFELPKLSTTTTNDSSLPSASSTTTTSMTSRSTTTGKKSKSNTTTTSTTDMTPPPMPSTISSLLDQSQRLKTASELNSAILSSQSHSKDPKLPGLMKMLIWGEQLLTNKGINYPQWDFNQLLKDNNNIQDDKNDGSVHDSNGVEAMVL